MGKPRALGFAAAALLLLAGLMLAYAFRAQDIVKEYRDIPLPSGQSLKGTLYRPTGVKQHLPGVVLVHGVIVNKEYMAALGETLAENGLAALAFDLGGYGESFSRPDSDEENVRETLAAVRFLQQQPGIDAARIGLVGHSMGGTAAILAAVEDPSIQAMASVGMSAQLQPFQPCNVLWSAGLYDPLHPPGEMRRALARSSGDAGYLEGADVHGGKCSHRLFLSPTANHQTEMFDRQVISEVTRWMQQHLDDWSPNQKDAQFTARTPISFPKFKAPMRRLGYTLAGIGAWLLLILLLGPLPNKRLLSLAFAGTMAAGLAAGYFRLLPPFLVSTGLMLVLFAMLASNFWTPSRHRDGLGLLLIAFTGIVMTDLVNLLNACWEYILNPQALTFVPQYLLQTWMNYLPLSLVSWRPHLFSLYTGTLVPSLWLLGLLGLEVLRPGIVLQGLTAISNRILALCRLQIANLKLSGRAPAWQLGLLAGLGILLLAMLAQRAATGFLSLEALQAVSQQGLRRFLPTAVLGILVLRRVPFRE